MPNLLIRTIFLILALSTSQVNVAQFIGDTSLTIIRFAGKNYKCKRGLSKTTYFQFEKHQLYIEDNNTVLVYDINASGSNRKQPLFKLKKLTLNEILNNSLYQKAIDSAYVEFDLNEFREFTNKSKNTYSLSLCFENSIIIFTPVSEQNTESNLKLKKLKAYNCCLSGRINKLIVTDTFAINYPDFIRLNLEGVNMNFLELSNPPVIYNDALHAPFMDDPLMYLQLSDSKVINSFFEISNYNKRLFIYKNYFKNSFHLTSYPFSKVELKDNHFSGFTEILGNSNADPNFLILENNKFSTALITDLAFLNSKLLKNNIWSKDLIVGIDPINDSLKTELPPSFLKNITFELINKNYQYPESYSLYDGQIPEMAYERGKSFLENQIAIIQNNTNIKPDLKDECLSRLEYQIKYLDYTYNASRFRELNLSDKFLLFVDAVLYLTVNFGYNGEINFIITCALISLFFSVLLYRKYYNDINIFFAKSESLKEAPEFLNISRTSFLKYFQVYYFSIIILISPKFPMKYFLLNNSLLRLIIIEWTIGIILIAIFLVYIASKYSFVKTLIGI